jgi:hypothetical protein
MKKIFLLLIIAILTGCGYQSVLTTQKANFSINKINHDNSIISKMIIANLNHFKKSENKIVNYDLDIFSEEKKINTLKNTKGDPTNFRLEIKVTVNYFENKELKLKKSYVEKFDYKNTLEKFELSQYENKIKDQIVAKLSERIILDLHEIK